MSNEAMFKIRYRLGVITVVLLACSTALAGVVFLAATTIEDSSLSVREILAAMTAAIISLAGATAFVFQNWLRRDREWQSAFIELFKQQSELNASMNRLVTSVEFLSDELRRIKGK